MVNGIKVQGDKGPRESRVKVIKGMKGIKESKGEVYGKQRGSRDKGI